MNPSRIYGKLLKHFGKQHWWPADSAFEVMIGAILTQQTTWLSVEKAIENLKKHGLLSPASLAGAKTGHIERLIRPTGFYKQKAGRIKAFSQYLRSRYNGSIYRLFTKRQTHKLREELLALDGIGNETADSILLYAGERLIFPIDAYTRRVSGRLGHKEDDYERLRAFFERNLPRSLAVYKEFHALLVRLAKEHCRIKPLCSGCPLGEECKRG